MTILEVLKQVRDDLKTWCTNNFNMKLNKNLGSVNGGKFLFTETNGEITTVTIDATKEELNHVAGTTANIQTQLNNKQPKGDYVSYTTETGVNILGTAKPVYVLAPPANDGDSGASSAPAYFPEGILMGGTAQSAGLMARGICGISTPQATTGACTKDNLYLNYDGSNDYVSNRQLVIQAGTVGTHYGNNVYQYAAVRGDALKAYCDANYAKTTEEWTFTYDDGSTETKTVYIG